MYVLHRFAALLLASAVLSNQSFAQGYPSRPIRLVVPFPAGADTDITARVVASWLDKRLKQPVVVENRPGGGQIIGTDHMLKSPADGYTLLFGAMNIGYLDAVSTATPFVPLRDIRTIAMIGGSGLVIVVNPRLPVSSIQEFVAYVRANPGKLNWGSAGPFPTAEIVDFKIKQGLTWLEVPFSGGGPAFTALLAGDVDAYNSSPTQALEAHRTGKVRILAYAEMQRHPMIPEIPTLHETVAPNLAARFWFGLFGQAALATDIVNKLNAEVLEMFKDPDSVARFQKFGYQTYPFTAEQAQREFERTSRLAAEIYKTLGIKPR